MEACQRFWDTGVAIDPTDFVLDAAVDIRWGYQCTAWNGTHLKFDLKNLDRRGFLSDLPLVQTPPKGYSTWIIYSSGGGPKKFVSCSTMSILETGTTHQVLAWRVGATHVHAAGEMLLTTTLTYNFISGTFMASLLAEKKKRRTSCPASMYSEFLEERVADFFKGTWTSLTLIREQTLPVQKSELDLLEKWGGIIQKFPSKEACVKGGRKTRRRKRLHIP